MHKTSQNFSPTLRLFFGGYGSSYRAFLAVIEINRIAAWCEVTAGKWFFP